MARNTAIGMKARRGEVARGETAGAYKWMALSCTSLGTLLATLNSGTLIIALPVLLRELHTDLITLVWVLLSYMLVQTVLVLTAGRLSDMVGRKHLFVLGSAAFGVASLIAGFVSTGGELVAVRVLQGAAGALMMATSSAIVTDAFPKRQLGVALGTNMIVAAVGSILGTILGGWLTLFGWQWVFWFNVPFSVIGTIWAWLNLREQGQIDRHQRFDIPGTITYLISITGLLLALTIGGIEGWTTPLVIGGFIAAIIFLPIFIVRELHARQPLLDLSLFRDRLFAMGNLSAFLNSLARLAVTFLFVFYFQGPLQKDALTAGILLTPIALGMLITSPISGYLADRHGSRLLASLGLVIAAVGLAGMALIQIDTPYWYTATVMFVMGAGSGLFNSPNTSAIMASVRPGQRGIAAGTRTMLMNTGGVFSIAFALAIVASTLPASVMFQIFAGVTAGVPASALTSFMNGLHISFWLMAAISLLAAVASAMRGSAHPGGVTEEDAVADVA
ncbi:MAG: Permease, multidrug efflux [Ktedonobacterales bacterium]|nr:MAG: Permease, multidrug efflux [Ktedonobacterales bacterium]